MNTYIQGCVVHDFLNSRFRVRHWVSVCLLVIIIIIIIISLPILLLLNIIIIIITIICKWYT